MRHQQCTDSQNIIVTIVAVITAMPSRNTAKIPCQTLLSPPADSCLAPPHNTKPNTAPIADTINGTTPKLKRYATKRFSIAVIPPSNPYSVGIAGGPVGYIPPTGFVPSAQPLAKAATANAGCATKKHTVIKSKGPYRFGESCCFFMKLSARSQSTERTRVAQKNSLRRYIGDSIVPCATWRWQSWRTLNTPITLEFQRITPAEESS